jgi:PAS domain S-box-containing protein
MVAAHNSHDPSPAEVEDFRRRCYEAEELCRVLLNLSIDSVVIYDMEGRTKYVSPSFTWTFGWPLEEIAGKRIDFVPASEAEATAGIIQTILGKGASVNGFETRRYTKDRHLLDVRISARKFTDHTGEYAGIVVILRVLDSEGAPGSDTGPEAPTS